MDFKYSWFLLKVLNAFQRNFDILRIKLSKKSYSMSETSTGGQEVDVFRRMIFGSGVCKRAGSNRRPVLRTRLKTRKMKTLFVNNNLNSNVGCLSIKIKQ
jgi:hypothetical protein